MPTAANNLKNDNSSGIRIPKLKKYPANPRTATMLSPFIPYPELAD